MEELQATQEEMQRGQAEAESTMEAINSSVAMIEFDADGYVINANQNFLDITGYYKDEVLGESHKLFASKDDKTSDTYKQFWKDLALGIAKYGEFERVGKGGKTIQMVESYAPIKSRDGSVGKIMMVAVDVSKYTTKA